MLTLQVVHEEHLLLLHCYLTEHFASKREKWSILPCPLQLGAQFRQKPIFNNCSIVGLSKNSRAEQSMLGIYSSSDIQGCVHCLSDDWMSPKNAKQAWPQNCKKSMWASYLNLKHHTVTAICKDHRPKAIEDAHDLGSLASSDGITHICCSPFCYG